MSVFQLDREDMIKAGLNVSVQIIRKIKMGCFMIIRSCYCGTDQSYSLVVTDTRTLQEPSQQVVLLEAASQCRAAGVT